MKILFLDFDGVITTYETGWTISLDKLALVDRIINETGARIVVTSSWKHGYSNVDGFKNSICSKRCSRTIKEETPFEKFIGQIYDITSGCGYRGEEVERWLEEHEDDVETYAILDDDSDFKKEQLFNFIQTDTYEGLTERETKMAISMLNNKKITNPIRLNLELTTMWRNRCSGLDKDNGIDEMLKEYYNRF